MIIVIAWKVQDFKVIKPGQPDIGIKPILQKIDVGMASIWAWEGTSEDLERAWLYILRPTSEGGIPDAKVFQYPTSEKDPLERARKEILED